MKILRLVIMTALTIVSFGWMVPLWIGLLFFNRWIVLDVEPFVKGINTPGNSFPFASTALQFIGYAAFWLTIVLLFWGVVLLKMFCGKYVMPKYVRPRGFPIEPTEQKRGQDSLKSNIP